MNIQLTETRVQEIQADAAVVGLFADGELTGPVQDVDKAGDGRLRKLIEREEISGKKYQTASLLTPLGVATDQVLVVGLGDRDQLDAGAAFRAAGAAAKALAGRERETVAYFLGDEVAGRFAEAAVAGAIAGSQGQDLYRAKKNLNPPKRMLWAGSEGSAVTRGRIVGESINFARRLVNSPAQEIYPESFAAAVSDMAGECGLHFEVWNQRKLEAERCGALLAVAKGSAREPRLVILRHQGAAVGAPTLALVGKGVTFDSGGLSIKPSDGMKDMKCDMAGAATVAGAMRAIAHLKLPVNVIGLAGLVENMTGPAAYKLGDVLTARNGTTIEVLNTDAEGRLVLADVLDVAVTSGAAKIIDLATLTGACMVALGLDVAGLMTNNQSWCDEVIASACDCGELVWQLPMFPEYDELIKSEVADIKNIGQGRWGGAITAAKLLERFVGDVPWTHVDIAGPAFRESAKPWCDAGASGEMVRTLVEVAKRWEVGQVAEKVGSS